MFEHTTDGHGVAIEGVHFFRHNGRVFPIVRGGADGDGDGEPGGSTSTATGDFTPITSQEEFDKALKPRLERERSKTADYKDLKDKASKYDELEQASKSDLEKANDRAAKAEAEAETIPAKVSEALRDHLVALHEISKDDAELFLTATDPELLVRQVNGLIGRAGAATEAKRKNGNQVSREGTNTPSGEDDPMREFARGLFNRT
jgi:hypothetical protein